MRGWREMTREGWHARRYHRRAAAWPGEAYYIGVMAYSMRAWLGGQKPRSYGCIAARWRRFWRAGGEAR